jgi:phosphoglycolate phosphatase
MMRYRGVFFDFDYTLGDATDAIFAGFTQGMTVLGHPVPEREAVRRTVGLVLEDAYTALSGDDTEEGRSRFRTLFSEVARPMQARGVPLCEGAAELIQALRAAGVATAVVSTKHTPTLVNILAAHGLERAFSSILGGDLVHRPKPDPEGILTAMARQGLETGDVLYCGDTVIDAETAARAGVDFCAVLNGTTPGDAFAAYPHVHIAPDLVELKDWLER